MPAGRIMDSSALMFLCAMSCRGNSRKCLPAPSRQLTKLDPPLRPEADREGGELLDRRPTAARMTNFARRLVVASPGRENVLEAPR